mgnify:CR=1 FL=1
MSMSDPYVRGDLYAVDNEATAPKLAPRRVRPDRLRASGNSVCKLRQEFAGNEAGVLRRIGVLDKPILGVQKGCDGWGNLATMDEVVEYDLRCGVLQEVAAIVYHQ